MRTLKLAGMMLAVILAAGFGPKALAQANDAQIRADAAKALNNPRFSHIQVDVRNDVVTLKGTVALYSDKEDADRKMHHLHHVQAVQNAIEVGGPGATVVEDATLAKRVGDKLATDRVGYGTTPFNAIDIGVQNGVVTLSGTVYGPTDKDVAISDTERTPGVRDVIDNIEVAPTSPMDDQLRLRLYRTVYGASTLSRYAMDPAQPIRITVVNGNVTLSGTVASATDKQVAGMQANSVPGVFKVTNNLQVESK